MSTCRYSQLIWDPTFSHLAIRQYVYIITVCDIVLDGLFAVVMTPRFELAQPAGLYILYFNIFLQRWDGQFTLCNGFVVSVCYTNCTSNSRL